MTARSRARWRIKFYHAFALARPPMMSSGYIYEPAGKGALRCIKRVLYPHLVLPDGWRETIPTEETLWADEDLEDTELFGIPVGEVIYGRPP